MKNLVRGGFVLAVLGFCVVFYYAQTQVGPVLVIADDSQPKIENNIDNSLSNNTLRQQDDKKKLVKTTASIRSTARGASRGSFSASAYCFSGKTAMGHSVRRGLIAADPRVLPLGSQVFIDAGPWSGTYTVSDTGGAIKGKKIDIWVPSCSEARRFGRRSVQIFSVQ